MVLGTLLAVPALAQIAKQGGDVLSSLSFVHEKLRPTEESEPLDDVRAVVDKSLQDGWEAFRIGAGPDADWNASIDKRTGLVTFAEGGNVAWIPGHGNQLTTRDIAGFLKARPRIDLEVLDAIARDYMPRVESFMGFDPGQLTLNRARSGQPASHLWFVDYDVVREGMPIEGARVVFRVNNGNLIQAGTENLPAPGATVPPARLTRKAALAAVANFIGGFQAGDSFRDNGSLHLLPVSIASARFAEGYELGKGRGIARVWQLVFHRDGVMGTWRARVDATTGEVLELTDINDYVSAQATGGTYLSSPATGGELVRPAPYADVSSGGFTNSAGIYNWTSQTNQTRQAVTAEDYPPIAGFYVGCTSLTCTADSETSSADGGIVNYTWTWGDGSTTTGGSPVSAPSHTYAAAGTYTITLTVRDNAGRTSTTSHAVTVSLGPTAAFTFHCTGLTCNFDASGSTSTVAITNYHWSWDDESTTDTASATTQHTYAYGSSFGVTLTITDANGAIASVTHTVSVP